MFWWCYECDISEAWWDHTHCASFWVTIWPRGQLVVSVCVHLVIWQKCTFMPISWSVHIQSAKVRPIPSQQTGTWSFIALRLLWCPCPNALFFAAQRSGWWGIWPMDLMWIERLNRKQQYQAKTKLIENDCYESQLDHLIASPSNLADQEFRFSLLLLLPRWKVQFTLNWPHLEGEQRW